MKSYETEPREDMSSTLSKGGNIARVDSIGSAEVVDVEHRVRNTEAAEIGQEVREVRTVAVVEKNDDEVSMAESEIVSDEYEEEQGDEHSRRRVAFVPPTRAQLLSWAPFWAVILLGGILRFWDLGAKPLHHDESLHAYFSLQLLHNLQDWAGCFNPGASCYHYDPLLHGPFQFHAIAFVYQVSQWLGAPDHGVNTVTVRIAAATLGTVIVGLPYFLRDYLGKIGAWLACFLLAVSPTMVYFSRFAREDIYMACFTLLMVVAIARYVRSRKMRWLVVAAAAFALSYATKEATFLSIAVFGSFLGALLAWELGTRWSFRSNVHSDAAFVEHLPKTWAPVFVLAYFVILAPIAKFFFGWMKALSIYITDPKNTPIADAYVANLKDKTVAIVPWIGIILGIYVLSILAREMFGRVLPEGRRGIAAHIDPKKQPLLDTIFTMQWTHWFFALLAGWTIFLVLFTVIFTNIRGGIGDGIWQGLYYWVQQQQVARGGQPWYYYLLLIPLYEQIGLIFGLVGIVRCLVQPNRFRLFMVYWFVGNVFIYSWAAEKMPWLTIHMTMPMMILAAIGLEPVVVTLFNWAKDVLENRTRQQGTKAVAVAEMGEGLFLPTPTRPKVGVFAGSSALACFVLAVLLLLPTLHNMYEVSYVHPADGPHEMLVYVQTTTDVNTVMAKIDALDQKVDGGNHQLHIGLMSDAEWPFAWYLRDYPNTCFGFPNYCPDAKTIPVIITGGDNLYSAQSQYATSKASPNYVFHQYQMRTWWDEGYKPPPCVASKANNNCEGQQTWGGVGPALWLSYGDNPPPGAKFNLGLAAKNIWQWWWQRKPFGSTDGAYDMGLLIRSDLGVTP